MRKNIKQNKRFTRILYNKIKNKPYIIFKNKKIYLKSENKKLVKTILNKYFFTTKKRINKPQAEKNINNYLKSNIKKHFLGNYKENLIDYPIKIQIEDKNKINKLTDKELRKIKPNKEQLKIEYLPNNKIKIKFDEENNIIFDDIQKLKEGMPKLWQEKKNEIKKEVKNKVLKEVKKRNILKKENIEEKFIIKLNNSENNLNELINNNLNLFSSSFLNGFFKINKYKNFEREITKKLNNFKQLPLNEKYEYYNNQMKILSGKNNNKLTKKDYKANIKKNDIIELQNISNYYDELKNIENELINAKNDKIKTQLLNTSEFENIISDKDNIKNYKNENLNENLGDIDEDLKDINEYQENIFIQNNDEEEKNNSFDDDNKFGFGKNNTKLKGALWNYEINEIMKPFNNYLFTIPLNNLSDIIKHIKENNLKNFSFIMNTETQQTKINGHWIAIYCDINNDMSFEIYDPLGQNRRNLYKRIHKLFTNLFNYFNVPQYLKFKFNKQKQQSITSNNCGWFCIRFLLMRYQNIPFKKATNYKGIKENEENINNMRANYNKFGYI